MAFNINAQIILSQPKNLNNIANQITKQLGKATKLNINIGNAKQLTTLSKQLTTLNNSFTKLNSNIVAVGKSQNVVNSQISKTNQSLKTQSGLVGSLGQRFGSVAKQAVAFGLISRPIYDLQRALTQAVQDAVKFERELVRISQVTGKSVDQLSSLTTQINKLSTELGINANELAETSRVIAQAGIRGKELDQVLTALARSTLAPTFGKITDTTEGLIAAFGQFGLKGRDAEAVLGSLNKVSKEFAVEAEDLISVVRRTGGVFAQAAGDTKGTIGALQELTAIFTAVRSTTRESADTIAAGLRTIFSRIQRRGTIDFLRQFNIDLVDAKGNFVGIFPAFDQLSSRLDTLIKQGDALTLSAIAEELGGIRQIGKLLPAIAQFDKAQNALRAAQKGAAEGLAGDVSKALDTTEKRVAKVRESFRQLIRTVFESESFQNFTKNILASANSFLEFANTITSALEPILPILTTIGAFKLGRGLSGILSGGVSGAVTSVTGSTATAQAAQKTAAATVNQNNLINTTNSTLTQMSRQLANLIQVNDGGFDRLISQGARNRSTVVTGFGGARRRASGGQIYGFNRGGMVPGTGNSDTVPAMLQPGEFVIKKSSVNSLGIDTLQAMNENRFQQGGKSKLSQLAGGQEISLAPAKLGIFKKALLRRSGDKDGDADLDIGGAFLRPSGVINNLRATIKGNEVLSEVVKDIGGTQPQVKKILQNSGMRSGEFSIPINIQSGSFTESQEVDFRSNFKKFANDFGADFNKRVTKLPYSSAKFDSAYNASNKEQIEGGIFESFLNAISNKPFDNAKINPNDTFDFKQGLGTAAKVFALPEDLTVDAKRTFDTDSLASLVKKGGNLLIENITRDLAIQLLAEDPENRKKAKKPMMDARRKAASTQKASGGAISGQDTVPALLTPGEFVFNKKAASRIGYGNLNTMNKQGVVGFNKGGVVGFNGGGQAKATKATGGAGRDLFGAVFALQTLTATTLDADSSLGNFANQLSTAIFALTAFQGFIPTDALKNLNVNFKAFSKDLSRKAAFKTFRGGGGLNAGMAAARNTAIATGALGATGAGILGAVGGGFAGRAAGQQIGNLIFGEEEQIGATRGSRDRTSARQRQETTQLSTAVGVGAGAGAGIGFLLGGPFGAALGAGIGAAVGGAGGLIFNELFGPIGADAQQAAFEIAKRLQDGGKAVSDSLDKLNKDFNSVSFGVFAREFNDQTRDLSASIPKLAQNLDDASLFRGRRKAELDVARSFTDIIKPEDLDKSRAAISQGLTKLFENIDSQDLSNILGAGNTDQFNQALVQAAQNGNLFAKEVLVSRNNLATQNALLKANELAEDKNSEQQKKTAIVLQNVARSFDFVTGSASDLDQAILKVAGENNLSAAETRFARTEIKKFAEDQKKGAQEEAKALAQQQQLNRALEESAQSVNAFNLAVKESVAGLTESLARSGEKFDLFAQRVADIESGSGAVRLDTSLANRGSDEVVSIIEKTSGRNLNAFRNLENAQKNLPNIVKTAVESIPATAGPQQTTDALIRSIQQQSGLQVSGDFREGLETRIRALVSSRQTQGGDDTVLAGKALAEALDKGEIDKLLGEVVQEQQTAFEELRKNAEVLRKQFENRINFEISRLKQAQAFEQKIFSKRLANENVINNILGRNVNQLDQAFSNLNRQLQTTAGTTNIGALLGQRESALAGKRQLEQQIELGDTSAETANQLIEFSRQLTESDAALKQFAEDTSIAAAIQAEASKLQQQRGAAESAIESIVSAGLGGNQGALKAISNQVQAFDRFQAGQANLQDVVSVFKNIEGPILSALAGDQAEEIKRFATGILAAQFKGTPAEGIIKRLQGQSVNVQERIFGLAQEANRINNLQLQALYAIQQQNEAAIGQAGAGTDPFSASVNVFSQAVGAFADVVTRGGGGVFAGGGPVNRAAGGIIYKNQGGVSDGTLVGEFASRFSKGTDTIPAMLSPGEYVISAPAVSKVGVGTLDAINSGNVATKSKGGILYREDGGEVKERIQRAKEQLKNIDINLGSFISDYDLNLLKFEDKQKTNEPYPQMTENGMYRAISNIVRNRDTAAMPDVFTKITKDEENRFSFQKNGLWQDEDFNKSWYEVMAKYMDSSLKSNIESERGLSNRTKNKITRDGVSILNMARRGSTNIKGRYAQGQAFTDPKARRRANDQDNVYFSLATADGSELATLFNFTQVLGANDRKKLYRQGFLEVNKEGVKDAYVQKDLIAEYGQQVAERLPAIISMLVQGKAQSDALRQQYTKQYFNIPNILDLPYIPNEGGIGKPKGRYYKDMPQLMNDKLSGYHFMLNRGSQDSFQRLMQPDILEVLKKIATNPQGWVDSYFAGNKAGVEMEALDLLINKGGTSSVFDQSLRSSLNPNNVMLSKSHVLLSQFLTNARSDSLQASNTYLAEKSKELSKYSLEKLKEIRSSDVTYPGPIGSPYKLLSKWGLPFTLAEIENEISRKEAEKAAAAAAGAETEEVEEPVDPADKFFKTKDDLYERIFSGKNDSPIYDINQKILKSNAFIETLIGKKRTPNIQRLLSRQYAINKKLIGIRAKKIFNLTRSAGALWQNDPLLTNPPDKGGLTVNEKQAVGQYNQLYAQALFTNDQNKYVDAEKFLQDFLSSGSPNSTKIRDRIAFVKRFLKITDNTLPIFHQGGFVQGYSKGGDVPIMAQQGEFIMNRRAVDRIGLGNMMSINNGGFGGGSTSLAKPIVELTRGIIGLSRLSQNIANLTASLNNPTLVAGMYQAFNDGASKLSIALQPLNNIPESIEMRLAPVDIAGLDGFTQQVVDGVINKLIDMSVIGQPAPQNAPTVRPGTDLY